MHKRVLLAELLETLMLVFAGTGEERFGNDHNSVTKL